MFKRESTSSIATRLGSVRALGAITVLGLAMIGGLLVSPAARADQINCTAENVMVFNNRVHIQCTASIGGILFFATPTTDSAHVARVLNVLATAAAAGRTVIIQYDPADTSGVAFGCQASDCRRLLAVGFLQ